MRHNTTGNLVCIIVFGATAIGWSTYAVTRNGAVGTEVSPDITVQPASIDLGDVGDRVCKIEYVISNTTALHVTGLTASTSCGCSVAVLSGTELAPSAKARLAVDFDPKGRRGTVTVYVVLEYDFGKHKQSRILPISANVKG